MKIRAVNTASDSENKIHDDTVAAQYGFQGGLVPGVTVYGYLAQAILNDDWLNHGAMDMRFHKPVYHEEEIEVCVAGDRVLIPDRAVATFWTADHPAPPEIPLSRRKPESIETGAILAPWNEKLDLAKSTITLPLSPSINGCAHPAVLLALANKIFVENFQLGPWIHVASEVRKFRAVRDGEEIQVRARIAETYEKKGHEFVVLDVVLAGIEYIRHTAIWKPRR